MARIGVIGTGRVGTVLAAALAKAGHEIVAVAGESDQSRERIAQLLPGVEIAKPTKVARSCDVLFLTVPDDMLGNVATTLVGAGAIRPGQIVVHTSGRHGLAILVAAKLAGAEVIAMHPAMTFTGTELDLPRLAGCTFGVTAEPQNLTFARELVSAFGGAVMEVPEAKRSLYHAGLAHGANYLVTLVSQAMEMLQAAGAVDPAATLRPLLTAALENTLASGDQALTGPIVRGDVNTVRAHLRELAQNSPDAIASYITLARATADRAVADGRLLPIRRNRLFAILAEAETRAAVQHFGEIVY